MGGRVKECGRKGGHGARVGRSRGRGNIYPIHIKNLNNNKKGLCSALGDHVFDYGQKWVADQMRTTWENIINHVGTIYGHNISNELQNKKQIEIPQPKYTHPVKVKHLKRFEQLRDQHPRLI